MWLVQLFININRTYYSGTNCPAKAKRKGFEIFLKALLFLGCGGRIGLHSLSLIYSFAFIRYRSPALFRPPFTWREPTSLVGSNHQPRHTKIKKASLMGWLFLFLVAGAGHSTTIHTNILKNIKFILKIAPYFFVDVIHSLAPYIPSFPKRQEHFSILKFHNYKI